MKSFGISFIVLLLIFSSSFLQVARCEPDPDADEVGSTNDGGEIGIVGDEEQDFDSGAYGGDSYSPALGVETICVFPKNPKKTIVAGEESELLVGVKNDGQSSVNVISIHANVHLPIDHQYFVQNLSTQNKNYPSGCYGTGMLVGSLACIEAFKKASVPPSAQATFPYIFAVSKFLQPGTFDLVGIIVYEIDQQPYQSTFFNGTIEVTESGGLFSVETVFLSCSFVAIIGFLTFHIYSVIQQRFKKTKKAPKVEVGTATTDSSMDEWLQGTAYTQGSKSKKKK